MYRKTILALPLAPAVRFWIMIYTVIGDMRWRSWLRHCATSWKVTGSIPDGVTEIFPERNPSGHTMGLGSTQPLTEMSIRNISRGVKSAGAWGWHPYHLHVPNVMKSGSLNLLEPSRPVQACTGIAFNILEHRQLMGSDQLHSGCNETSNDCPFPTFILFPFCSITN